ncbi:MAG: hypothetical protein M1820_001050 [Bogoriella megaspora]|nr:MAG: hypothetical protein M1820_001050 [Bogoriella megaspora]
MVAFDDFNFGFVDDQCLADILLDIIQSDEPQALRALEACRNANAMLRQTRVQSARRSFLAVVSYAASLFISLDSNRDSGTMSIHVPHTIALRELYYWLIPVITLSAANGAFPTAWTSYAILHPMVDIINSAGFSCKIQPLKSYSGGSYIWRPNKSLRTRSPALTPSLRSRPMLLLQLSFLSVATAWLFSFLVSWYTPTVGLGCRSITELAYFVTWLFSCCMSAILSRMIKKYNLLFAITFAKDALLAIPMVIVLFAAFRGWWNSCQCWSARWTLGFSEAEVPLNITTRESQLNSFYEWMIGSALGIQCALAVVYLVLYRRELHLMYAGHEDVVAYYRR